MSNLKIVYFNTETISKISLEKKIFSNINFVSHYEIKPGLFLINFNGTAKELYDSVNTIVNENSIFIHDLDCVPGAYWGFITKNIWTWLKENKTK